MSWYKSASKKGNIPYSENSGDSQKSWNTHMGDYQRWIVDSYEATVYLTKTDYKITISITVNKVHLGTIMLQMFWKYDLKEEKRATKAYEQIIKAVSNIFDDLTNKELPSSLYESMIRHDCRKIDTEKLAKTTIPNFNYSQNIEYERDWRSSLYGNRYPKPNDTSAF